MSVFVIYVLIIIIVLASVSKKKKQSGDRFAKRPANVAARTSAAKKRDMQSYQQAYRSKIPNTSGNHVRKEKPLEMSCYEDRDNDWLANQMREERAALYRLQDMFSFRMQGRNITDAELLKEFHVEHCDADRVDRAAGK